MEKVIRKSAIYGLAIGLSLAILFVDYKEVEQLGEGSTLTSYKNPFEYIVSLLRFSVIGMFVGLFIGWNIEGRKKEEKHAKTYYIPVFFAIFILAVITQFILGW
ncbi:hypothetical protein [Fredinandcohnia sp. 179-A 10B2 NHS]|uniref:hypothetical protein n=1 Tax=Fredinandcohnia sp. 179-A 10B2 NHS TaxID=3235176 RepID=UPI0039A308B7